MRLVDFITKVFFGNYNSAGFYKADAPKEKVSYTFTSIFPNAKVEETVLKAR